jgi:hypothetical protein
MMRKMLVSFRDWSNWKEVDADVFCLIRIKYDTSTSFVSGEGDRKYDVAVGTAKGCSKWEEGISIGKSGIEGAVFEEWFRG